MTPRLLTLATLVALALTACNKPAPAPATGTPAATAAEASDAAVEPAPAITADAPKPEGTFSAAAMAGRFEGEGTLLLNPDGTFNHTVGEATTDGTWGAEPTDPTRVRLDPNSKASQDQVLQVVSNDELKPIAAENAKTPTSGQAFKRAATP